MVKVCKTAPEFSKLKSEDFDYGPEIYGNIDVTGKILAETLSLDERTIRKYAERGIVHRSPENVGLYRFEPSMHRYLPRRFFGAWELSRTTTMGGTFRGPGPERCRAR